MAPMSNFQFSRRSFLAMSATLPWALRGVRSGSAPSPSIPVGLELYSVRNELEKDPQGTVRAVAQMGYQMERRTGETDAQAAGRVAYPLLLHPQR